MSKPKECTCRKDCACRKDIKEVVISFRATKAFAEALDRYCEKECVRRSLVCFDILDDALSFYK